MSDEATPDPITGLTLEEHLKASVGSLHDLAGMPADYARMLVLGHCGVHLKHTQYPKLLYTHGSYRHSELPTVQKLPDPFPPEDAPVPDTGQQWLDLIDSLFPERAQPAKEASGQYIDTSINPTVIHVEAVNAPVAENVATMDTANPAQS